MKKNNYYNKREARTGMLFVLPGLLYMMLLIGYPIIYNIVISFQDVNVMTIRNAEAAFVGLENYLYLFQDDIIWQVMKQTFVFTFWCIVFQLSIGLLLAVFFNQKFRMAKPARGLLLVVWVVPMTVVALIFKFMFQTDGGLINTILLNLHLISQPIQWLVNAKTAMTTLIITNCWVGIPFNMILLTAGLNGISPDIYESASIDGANVFVQFFRITLPLLRPAIMSVLIMGVIYTFKVFDLVYVMTSGGPNNTTELLSTYSYRLSFTEYQFSKGAAAANVLLLCLAVVAAVYVKMMRKDEVM